MATPRRLDAALQLTPYFHCTSRCVRGSFLCGIDRTTGQDFTHRRRWLRKRLLQLATIFSIKLVAFAIMENHFHVVLRVDRDIAETWSDDEVILRWHQLFKGTELSRRHSDSETLDSSELKILSASVRRWRNALHDISWLMRCAKEPLARLSNREDDCKGRFWEGRFHSQTLLDARAVVACMAYVDLNPTRAQMCSVPEEDPFTSLHCRFKAAYNDTAATEPLPPGLINLDEQSENKRYPQLLVNTLEYIELVDLTARLHRPDKRGALSSQAMPALQRLGINKASWQELEKCFKQHFHVLVGTSASLKQACQALGKRYAWGQKECHDFFNGAPI
ncbi:transposase [Granulosicoccus antarcticus]|uniref:Transposase IS200-like domain-containing protein n=1 Tax=Granulosicoccus antarcticus IMCC3135 TaxID=1192854 RepID=A0A2Z2P700_9GAMM|nr:transposase [Granulosicoccus antarcticus]ASJ76467.1 hypothetical protein IMCC3135_32105 [Granulosicoccus antarcticus IMCC3135]